jgi:hypothetical protein
MQGPWNQEEKSYPYTSGSTGQVTACRPSTGGFHTSAVVSGMYNKWYTNENEMETVVMTAPTVTSLQVWRKKDSANSSEQIILFSPYNKKQVQWNSNQKSFLLIWLHALPAFLKTNLNV